MTLDDALVARAVEGDRAAFATLAERYYVPCWQFALRMLGNETDAEDAVHDAFLRVQRALPRYEPRDRFRAWLFRVLANQCRSAALRRRRREHRFLADDRIGDRAADEGPASGDGEHDLTRAMAALRPQDREVLLLKYGDGMDYLEMSRVLGASESALKMRVSRAREALRGALAALGRRDDDAP